MWVLLTDSESVVEEVKETDNTIHIVYPKTGDDKSTREAIAALDHISTWEDGVCALLSSLPDAECEAHAHLVAATASAPPGVRILVLAPPGKHAAAWQQMLPSAEVVPSLSPIQTALATLSSSPRTHLVLPGMDGSIHVDHVAPSLASVPLTALHAVSRTGVAPWLWSGESFRVALRWNGTSASRVAAKMLAKCVLLVRVGEEGEGRYALLAQETLHLLFAPGKESTFAPGLESVFASAWEHASGDWMGDGIHALQSVCQRIPRPEAGDELAALLGGKKKKEEGSAAEKARASRAPATPRTKHCPASVVASFTRKGLAARRGGRPVFPDMTGDEVLDYRAMRSEQGSPKGWREAEALFAEAESRVHGVRHHPAPVHDPKALVAHERGSLLKDTPETPLMAPRRVGSYMSSSSPAQSVRSMARKQARAAERSRRDVSGGSAATGGSKRKGPDARKPGDINKARLRSAVLVELRGILGRNHPALKECYKKLFQVCKLFIGSLSKDLIDESVFQGTAERNAMSVVQQMVSMQDLLDAQTRMSSSSPAVGPRFKRPRPQPKLFSRPAPRAAKRPKPLPPPRPTPVPTHQPAPSYSRTLVFEDSSDDHGPNALGPLSSYARRHRRKTTPTPPPSTTMKTTSDQM